MMQALKPVRSVTQCSVIFLVKGIMHIQLRHNMQRLGGIMGFYEKLSFICQNKCSEISPLLVPLGSVH